MTEKVQYIYHWNRIFGAIAGLVLLLCAISYAVYSWVKTEMPQGPAKTALVTSNQESGPQDHSRPRMSDNPWVVTDNGQPSDSSSRHDVSPSSLQYPNHPSIDSLQSQPIISEVSSMPVLEVENDLPPPDAETEQPSISHETIVVAPLPTETNQVFSSDQPQPETLHEVDPITIPEQSETIAQAPYAADTKQDSFPDQPHPGMLQTPDLATLLQQSEAAQADISHDTDEKIFQLQSINRFSPAVKRFTLARTISDKEPIGTVDSISMDTKGVAIIYAFSEIIDMRDRTLYYNWYHEGERVAKVPVPIGADSWRSNSSKYINNKMQGEWLVELHADDGQILASAQFFSGTQ